MGSWVHLRNMGHYHSCPLLPRILRCPNFGCSLEPIARTPSSAWYGFTYQVYKYETPIPFWEMRGLHMVLPVKSTNMKPIFPSGGCEDSIWFYLSNLQIWNPYSLLGDARTSYGLTCQVYKYETHIPFREMRGLHMVFPVKYTNMKPIFPSGRCEDFIWFDLSSIQIWNPYSLQGDARTSYGFTCQVYTYETHIPFREMRGLHMVLPVKSTHMKPIFPSGRCEDFIWFYLSSLQIWNPYSLQGDARTSYVFSCQVYKYETHTPFREMRGLHMVWPVKSTHMKPIFPSGGWMDFIWFYLSSLQIWNPYSLQGDARTSYGFTCQIYKYETHIPFWGMRGTA